MLKAAVTSAITGVVAACTDTGSGSTDDTAPLDTSGRDTDTDTTNDRRCPDYVPHGTEAEGWTRIPLSSYPELQEDYSGVAIQVGGTRVNVANMGDQCFVGMSTVCTHEGCTVAYARTRNQFACPCHGAIFNGFGDPVAGPTFDPLTAYDTDFDGEAIWIRVANGA